LSKMNSASDALPVDLPPEFSGLFHRHVDRVLADDSLSDLDVILLSVYLIENKNKRAGADYDECKQLFTGLGRKEVNYKANIYNAKKMSLIVGKNAKLFLAIGGLKRIRRLFGQIGKSPVHVIKSGQNFSAIKLLEEFLFQEVTAGEILLCDSYIAPATLFPFSVLKGHINAIKILATKMQDEDKFGDYKAKFEKETGITIAVRVSTKIHDRYLISGDKCWSFGASIKDLGNKDTTIKEISDVTASMKDLFTERWNESPDLSQGKSSA
jgi:hypothetical protein